MCWFDSTPLNSWTGRSHWIHSPPSVVGRLPHRARCVSWALPESQGQGGAGSPAAGEVVSAETFVPDFREVTQLRVQTTDLTAQHARAMSVGEVAFRL